MKKVMMMAMMLIASATAFAGDSDALKAIKKAKTYDEAAQLLKTAQLTNDEQYVLETFYDESSYGSSAAWYIAEHYQIEQASAYRKKNRALDHLTVLLFGKM